MRLSATTSPSSGPWPCPTDTVLAATRTSVQADIERWRAAPVAYPGTAPALYSEMGVVSLRNRTPSPMAQHAIACISRVAGEVNI
ncbi:hypothetical protein ACU4GD_01225 [Cupriavidus basilensis]